MLSALVGSTFHFFSPAAPISSLRIAFPVGYSTWKTSWQNGYIESFHRRFRDECLNREWLLNLREARVVIEDWRQHYNTERPHTQLGYISPEGFINNQKAST